MHTAAPPQGYCLKPGEELREYMRRSVYLARGSSPTPRGLVVAVGDYTLRRLLSEGVEPILAIVDCLTRRERVECPGLPGYRVLRVHNPRGYISWQAWLAVAGAWGEKTLVVVDGEEDLLAIPAILEAPGDALIAYGIPWAGLNVVEAYTAKPLAEYIARSSRVTLCPVQAQNVGAYSETTRAYPVYTGVEHTTPTVL